MLFFRNITYSPLTRFTADADVSHAVRFFKRRQTFGIRLAASLLVILQMVSAIPVRAQAPAESSSMDEAPCGLSGEFIGLHRKIADLGERARDDGAYVKRIRRTARRYPYKHIEAEWSTLQGENEAALDGVTRLPIVLEGMPDGEAKQAALDLAAAYQKGFEDILDYGRAIVFYERAENNNSIIFAKQATALNFSLPRSKGRSYVDDGARHFLDWRSTEIGDVFRSLKLPEYRYGKRCDALPASPVAAIADPCALEHRFAAVRATIMKLDAEAIDAAETAKRLHHTSLWRPYKRVEKDWFDVLAHTDPALETLSDVPVALDDASDSGKKRAALDLDAAYQGSLRHILNYAHWAVYDERAENLASVNLSPNVPAFGALRDSTKSSQSIAVRQFLEARLTEPGNAALSIQIPESRFGRLCGGRFIRVAVKAADPCKSAGRFTMLRSHIATIGKETGDTGQAALRIAHVSRWVPYKRIERRWSVIIRSSEPAMKELADLSVALDAVPDSEKKRAAIALLFAYQAALEHFIDYGNDAVAYERSESALSMNFSPGYFNYGVTIISTTMNRDSLMRRYLDAKYTENDDAFRSLRLPEHHYLGLCKTSFPESLVARVSVP
jgi:hypothetical protein